MSQKRRRWSSEDKLRIVLTGLQGDIGVSELCRREGINPTQYYAWKRRLMRSAGKIFAKDSNRPDASTRRLQEDLQRAKDVIAEITAENLDLKKGLWV